MGYPKIAPVAKTVSGDSVFHPNFSQGKICIMDNWYPTTQITDLVREIADMLQWKKYNIRSPLNAVAAEWSQKNQNLLPLGKIEVGAK
jgi:ubiquitin-protein ligase